MNVARRYLRGWLPGDNNRGADIAQPAAALIGPSSVPYLDPTNPGAGSTAGRQMMDQRDCRPVFEQRFGFAATRR